MDPETASPPSAGLDLGAIYYALFRHKGKIIFCSVAGICAAFAYYTLRPPPYTSEAEVLVNYVVTETAPTGPNSGDAVTKSPDQRGETIINSEVHILTSQDLLREVAARIGPERILGPGSEPPSADAAGIAIGKDLVVTTPSASRVIQITYSNSDPTVVQPVLSALITAYLAKSTELHQPGGMMDVTLSAETDRLKAALSNDDNEINQLMDEAGIAGLSLDDFKKSINAQITTVEEQIRDLQAELAARRTTYAAMTASPDQVATDMTTAPTSPEPSDADRETYAKLAAQDDTLLKQENDLLTRFTADSTRVQDVRTLREQTEKKMEVLEAAYPTLQILRSSTVGATGTARAPYDARAEAAWIKGAEAQLKTRQDALTQLQAQRSKVADIEPRILALNRQRDKDQRNYDYYAAREDQQKTADALGSSRISDIRISQSPSTPLRSWGKKLRILAGLCVGGVGVGIGWAFLIELYLDRSIRRPFEVERMLRLPLFLSLPRFHGSARRELKRRSSGKTSRKSTALVTRPSAGNQLLNPFFETLRDRLFQYFDGLNIRHKPKLVAVTGVGRETGVSTVAANLARSISETGEGNVLLVDMTQEQGTVQRFQRGKSAGLDDVFEARQSAQVGEKLYVVGDASAKSDRLARNMPQRFQQLIPKLKSSDFDYIIFDMPAVNQISITPRLASFMDVVLMVLESEKTDRDVAQRASALLAQSNAPVGVVLNKTKTYVPGSLQPDNEFLLGS